MKIFKLGRVFEILQEKIYQINENFQNCRALNPKNLLLVQSCIRGDVPIFF